jgi:aspartyl/asparaginyl-tRNA synthetase
LYAFWFINFFFYFFFFFCSISKESIVDVHAEVKKSPEKVEGCTQKDVELHVKQIWVVSASEPQLPLQIEDASRRVTAEDESEEGLNIKVNQDTRLDNRILDLRTPTNQAIFRSVLNYLDFLISEKYKFDTFLQLRIFFSKHFF